MLPREFEAERLVIRFLKKHFASELVIQIILFSDHYFWSDLGYVIPEHLTVLESDYCSTYCMLKVVGPPRVLRTHINLEKFPSWTGTVAFRRRLITKGRTFSTDFHVYDVDREGNEGKKVVPHQGKKRLHRQITSANATLWGRRPF